MNQKKPQKTVVQGGNVYGKAPIISGAGNPMRAAYNAMKRYYRARGIDPVITESYLRLESVLGNQNAIVFNALAQNANVAPRSTEQRLQLTDAFYITSLGFFIGKQASGADPTSLVLDTYVNPQVYTGAGEAAALNAIYNGKLNIQINRTDYLPAWDLKRHEYVSTAQQLLGTTTTTNLAAGGTAAYARSSYDDEKIFKPVTPGLNIQGNSQLGISVQLGASPNMAGTGGTTNVAVLYCRGLLIQNVTQ